MTCECKKDFLSLKDKYELMTAQLDRELSLVNNRVSWFLTFNGFIFAAFILSFRVDAGDNTAVLTTVRFLFLIAGIVFATFIFFALLASQNARDKLKVYWEERNDGNFPPAYSDKPNSVLGRIASIMVPLITGTMWLVILFAVGNSNY